MEQRDSRGLTEKEFLAAYAKKNYPRPYLTADVLLLTEDKSRVLLVKRKGHPFLGKWALPGGFSVPEESLEETALREMREETGIVDLLPEDIHEIGIFSRPGRDPRGWVVTGAYMALVDSDRMKVNAGDDAADAGWFSIVHEDDGTLLLQKDDETLLFSDLAFDHADILTRALQGTHMS